jgi:glutathione S-transferase
MAGLKIYGVARSRAFRTLWMAGELGIPYEHVKVDFEGGTRKAEFLKINPNGHVPAIEDGGFVLWESMAINLYLAKKYGSGTLYPTSLEGEALAWQWSFWGMTEVERPALTVLFHRVVYPEDRRDKGQADEAEEQLRAPLNVLDGIVRGGRHLIGDSFGVADLNVASILSWARQARVDMAAFPNAAAWLKTCHDRPAAQQARQMQRE